MRKTLAAIGVALLFFLTLGWIVGAQQQADEQHIEKWAAENNHEIKKLERCFFHRGPYWLNCDSDRFYKVETNDKTFWFRFRVFCTDVEQE